MTAFPLDRKLHPTEHIEQNNSNYVDLNYAVPKRKSFHLKNVKRKRKEHTAYAFIRWAVLIVSGCIDEPYKIS